MQNVDGVREKLGDGVEGFDCAGRATRKIYDDCVAANRGDGARQKRAVHLFRTFSAHVLGKPWNKAFGGRDGRLWSYIARANTCSTGREN